MHHIKEAWHQQSMVAGAGSWEIISQSGTRSSEWTSSRTIYAISRPTLSGVLPLERLQPSKTFQTTSSTENWVVTIPQPMGNIYHSVHHSSEAVLCILEYWINVTYVCPKPSEVQLKWKPTVNYWLGAVTVCRHSSSIISTILTCWGDVDNTRVYPAWK